MASTNMTYTFRKLPEDATLTIHVRFSKSLRLRLAIGKMLVNLAAWIMGIKAQVVEEGE